jgi:UDPglucose 6-dehydrogenase
MRPSSICVVGAGHVGLVTAACLAELGHRVTCVDVDEDRVEALRIGSVPIHEPGLEALITRHTAGGALKFTTSYDEALEGVEFIFIAVNTPSTPEGAADLRYVRRAARQIGHALKNGHPIIVNKSTVPVGTAETVDHILRQEASDLGELPVVSNPEFLREGTAIEDFMKPDRVVLGCRDREAAQRVAGLYGSLDAPVLIADPETAEMIKYASNAFLATKISFINEIASVCEGVGADVNQVAQGMGLDRRIGPQFLRAGIGYGGSCLPKDVKALAHMASIYGSHPQLLNAVLQINVDQRRRVVRRLRQILGSLEGAAVAVLGLAYKADTDDVRDAPAIDIMRLLDYEGAAVRAYDPVANDALAEILPDVTYCSDPYEAVSGCDAVIIATEWPEFVDMDLGRVKASMRRPVLVDGRNLLDPDVVRSHGFVYLGVGRPDHLEEPLVLEPQAKEA